MAYLKQYRACLAEEQVDRLEGLWTQLDALWMRIKHWVQIVHDIEYGYGDPLRCKVGAACSISIHCRHFRGTARWCARYQYVPAFLWVGLCHCASHSIVGLTCFLKQQSWLLSASYGTHRLCSLQCKSSQPAAWL